jgi:hypothetical protein
MTTITIPRETFDAMREALEVLNHLDADINFLNTNKLEEMMDKALSAAKAVSETKVKLIPTAEELGTPVQPQAQGGATNFPFYELKFIMRVLGHKGDAPKADWDTAYGMAREIFTRWHTASINPQASGPAWLPIETAPKDETQPFLAWVPMDDFVDGVIVQVSMFEGRMYHDAKGASIDWDDAVENATHWMPLPAAPEAMK